MVANIIVLFIHDNLSLLLLRRQSLITSKLYAKNYLSIVFLTRRIRSLSLLLFFFFLTLYTLTIYTDDLFKLGIYLCVVLVLILPFSCKV